MGGDVVTQRGLCDQAGKIEAARQVIAGEGDQTADIESRLHRLVAAHTCTALRTLQCRCGTIAFLDLGLSAKQSPFRMQATGAGTFTETSGTLYAQTDSAGLIAEPDNQNNIYSAGTQVCLASPDSFGNDGGPASASLIATGDSQTHNFDVLDDNDWIKFNAQAGTTYRLATSNLGISADTYLYLYDTDGQTLIASNDDSDNSLASQIDWTAPQSGTYYALVKNWNPNTGGCGTGYTVGLSNVSPTSTDWIYLPLVIR